MDLQNGLFWLLLLQVTVLQGVSSNQINNSKLFDINGILEVTGSIIESCFTQYSRNVFISDTWEKEDNTILNRTFSLFLPLKLFNLQDNKTFSVSNTNRFLSAYTDKNYIIVISSKYNLLTALEKLRNSKLWDHGGFFVVVYKHFYEGCQKNKDLLDIIWSFNILSIILLCGNLKNQNYLYTFNPYTNIAPSFWTVIENRYRKNNQVWILKHRLKDPLIPSAALLNDLNFDKAKNLGGYTIKVGVGYNHRSKYDIKKTGAHQYLGKMGALNHMMWNHLNGTIELRHYPTMCFQNKMDQKCEIYKDLSDGKIDYLINQLFTHAFWKYHTFPKETVGLCVLAKMSKQTVFKKFLLTFTPSFWIIMGSTTLFIIIFQKHFLNRSVVVCLLETLRIFLYMPSHQQPQQPFQRLLFIMLIFITTALNWNFQSHLSALFVVPDLHPYIDSLQDLENSHLSVYGQKDFREYFFPSNIYYHYAAIDKLDDCIDQLKSGNSVSCIFPCSEKNAIEQSERVHLTKYPIKELFVTTYVRRDWPLFSKIDELIHKIYEAGFLKLFQKRESQLLHRATEKKENFFKFSTSNLYISSLILIFGLIAATSILIMEVIIKLLLDC